MSLHPTNAALRDQPPAKRQKTTACQRCRHRKQKCDGNRPCRNCARSDVECRQSRPETEPEVRYIEALEQRIAHLEASSPTLQFRSSRKTPPSSHGDSPDMVVSNAFAPREAETSSPRLPSLNDLDTGNHSTTSRTEATYEHGTLMGQSASTIGLLGVFAPLDQSMMAHNDTTPPNKTSFVQLSQASEDVTIKHYLTKAHSRYPFLCWSTFRSWLRVWRHRNSLNLSEQKLELGSYEGFFVNMVFAVGLLLQREGLRGANDSHHILYSYAITKHLSFVFAQPDRTLHTQAYLLLAMHALHTPTTERIIAISSAAMRYCVMSQFYLSETEPVGCDVTTRLHIQMRRRVFWSAYALDRAVGSMFDLPFSIPDDCITVKMYANVDDSELEEALKVSSVSDLPSKANQTNISAALHVLHCRQIQSKILHHTLSRDFREEPESQSVWRAGILQKLEEWRSLCHQFGDTSSKSYTSDRWLHMIYNYSLVMLYRPTKQTLRGAAGDSIVKACVQACLTFRKFQMDKEITEPWMGLVAQFQCGITLLYCFWATPPIHRTEVYDSSEIPDALRACSNILAILAERWPQAICLRDVFDVFVREIPLYDRWPRRRFTNPDSDTSTPRRIGAKAVATVEKEMRQLQSIVVHRGVLRMIEQMIREPFPRSSEELSCDTNDLARSDETRVSEFSGEFGLGEGELDPSGSEYLTAQASDYVFGDLSPGFNFDFDTTQSPDVFYRNDSAQIWRGAASPIAQ